MVRSQHPQRVRLIFCKIMRVIFRWLCAARLVSGVGSVDRDGRVGVSVGRYNGPGPVILETSIVIRGVVCLVSVCIGLLSSFGQNLMMVS